MYPNPTLIFFFFQKNNLEMKREIESESESEIEVEVENDAEIHRETSAQKKLRLAHELFSKEKQVQVLEIDAKEIDNEILQKRFQKVEYKSIKNIEYALKDSHSFKTKQHTNGICFFNDNIHFIAGSTIYYLENGFKKTFSKTSQNFVSMVASSDGIYMVSLNICF